MIIPLFSKVFKISKIPVTWTLIFLNFFFFLTTSKSRENLEELWSSTLKDKYFIEQNAEIFSRYVKENPENYSLLIRKMADQFYSGDHKNIQIFSSLGLRDIRFLNSKNLSYEDAVGFEVWKQKIDQFLLNYQSEPLSIWGLGAYQTGFMSWFSYQFLHSSFFHFIINMFFLIIFGAAIEVLFSSVTVFLIYILGGFAGAWFFIELTSPSMIPLVGASASVSGMLSFLCCYHLRKKIRYFWFIAPAKHFYGTVLLPSWFAILIWIVSDFSGYLGTVIELGSIGYSSHLGGELIGGLVGLLFFGNTYFFLQKKNLSKDIEG